MCIEKKTYASLFLKTRIVINRRHPNRKANKAPTTVYNNPVKRPYKVKNINAHVCKMKTNIHMTSVDSIFNLYLYEGCPKIM